MPEAESQLLQAVTDIPKAILNKLETEDGIDDAESQSILEVATEALADFITVTADDPKQEPH